MVSDSEKPFKEGYLWFPPHGVLGQLKKSWQKKFCQLFKASKYGIDRLEVFDNEDIGKSSSNSIITLENCIKITHDAQKPQPHAFMVVTKSAVHHFAANSETDLSSWIAAFQAVAFKDNVSRQTVEEDNDLYCSSGDAGVFSVRLVSSDASERCGLKPGPYTLVLTPSALQLRDSSEQSILYTWPYQFIRRYGKSSGRFTFEAGRKCHSGEGIFHVEHSNHQEIFRCISSKMNYMKKMLIGDPLPPSPAIECGDNQFNAALSMTAGSRSPLPPSPTSATTTSIGLLDSDFSAISSIKPLLSDSHECIPSSRNVLKPKPQKPPRKFPPPATTTNEAQSSSSVNGSLPKTLPQSSNVNTSIPKPIPRGATSSNSGTIPKPPQQLPSSSGVIFKPAPSAPCEPEAVYTNILHSGPDDDYYDDNDSQAYDDVEVRSEAWRTMGVDVATHTERPFGLMQAQENELRRSGRIFIQPTNTFNDYDRLQHLGPVSKSIPCSGYKQLNAISATVTSAPVFNQSMDDIQVARKADDSHLGYGIIRKKSVPPSVNSRYSLQITPLSGSVGVKDSSDKKKPGFWKYKKETSFKRS